MSCARALQDAQLEDFLARLPQGLETTVGEHGHSISAGERQRIAIARALLRDPRLLILDEATASLDVATERDLRRALDVVTAAAARLVVVTHRIETVMDADRIVVMDRGRVVGARDARRAAPSRRSIGRIAPGSDRRDRR